jgi:hypothetical protein
MPPQNVFTRMRSVRRKDGCRGALSRPKVQPGLPSNRIASLRNPQRGVRTEWNVLSGPLWTSSTTITGLPKTSGGPATLTFAQVVAANPRMTVTGIGFGLGTYNAGVTAVLDEQRFATTSDCTEHQWSTGFKNGGWWPGWL